MPVTIPLWKTSGSSDPRNATSLTYHAAAKSQNGAAVLILPGGGYGGLADHEGPVIGDWLASNGIHGVVLRYRLSPNRHPAMINDAQRGMRLTRAHAAEWGINPSRIAVLGFSAGGHLSASLATMFDEFTNPDDDLAAKHSARPDAAVLCYPVIDLGEWAHVGSRHNLLGNPPDPAMVEHMSTHKRVSAKTPPTFLWHTSDDEAVPVEGALLFTMACRKHRVPVEIHSYESGRHGLGLAKDAPDVAPWADACLRFLRRRLA